MRVEAAFIKPDKSMLLKLSVRSAGREFQIVGEAWRVAERATAENSSGSSIVKQLMVV